MKENKNNKIANTVAQRSKRGMRPKIRGQLGTNTLLTGNELLESVSQALAAVDGANFYPLVAGNSQGRNSVLFAGVSRYFQKYLYEPGTSLHYQPAVGLNTAGTIYVAFIDNPELVSSYHGQTTANRLSIIKTSANMKAYPVWQEFVYNLVATPRQKRFSSDASLTWSNPEQLNRAVQGAFVVGVEGLEELEAAATTAKTIGTCFLTQRLRLEELSNYVA